MNPKDEAVISNKVFEKNRYKLGIYGQRLLIALIQNIDSSEDCFPVWKINMPDLFEYIGVENNNSRYKIVKDAFFEIAKNPMEEEYGRDKNGKAKWKVHPWFGAEFDPDLGDFVTLTFQPGITPYLLKLKDNFCKLKCTTVIKLKTQYATWLYPMLKTKFDYHREHSEIVIVEIPIQRLKEFTFTEHDKSYDPKKNTSANRNFLKRVIGIKKNKKNKKSNEWEYTRNSKNEYNGSLFEISSNTEFAVTAIPFKSGRSYDRIQFTIRAKTRPNEKTVKKQERTELKKYLKDVDQYQEQIDQILNDFEIEFKRKPNSIEFAKYLRDKYRLDMELTVVKQKQPTPIIEGTDKNYVISIRDMETNKTIFMLRKLGI